MHFNLHNASQVVCEAGYQLQMSVLLANHNWVKYLERKL